MSLPIKSDQKGIYDAVYGPQKLIFLLEHSNDFVSLSDMEGNVDYVNEAGRKMMGLDTMDEVKRPNSEYLMAGELSKLKKEINKTLMEKGKWSGEVIYRHFKTGEPIPVYSTTMLVYDPETGEPRGRASISRDLRQEKMFRKALMEGEQRFRSLVEHAPVAIGVLKGKDMVIEIANNALLQLWGKGPEIIGQPIIAALPEIKEQPFPDLLQQVLESGSTYYGFETPARLVRNGRTEDCYFNFIYAAFKEENRITGIQIVANEVTAQVRANKELKASEEHFRNFVLSSPMPIGVYIGREMRIQIANNAILGAWNKDASIIGKTFREALPELEGQPFYRLLDEVYTTGIPYVATEDRVDLLFDGAMQTFYYNFTYKPLRDGEGKIFGVINTATNVTDLVLARKQLAEAEDQLRMAIEAAEMSTWNIDLVTGEVHFSERVREWYGFSGEAIDMQSGFLAIHEEDRERVVERFRQSLQPEAGDFYEDEYRIINLRDGSMRIVRPVGKVFFNEEKEPYLISGIVQDITKQRMYEEELERQVQLRTKELQLANRQLEQSNRELEQFAYVTSHDLQEPLRKIKLFAGMLKEHLKIDSDPLARQYLGKIPASAERMSTLIKDLLNYYRLSAKDELISSVDLNEVLKNVEEDFELLIQQKNAVIQTTPLPRIQAIPLQMNQLFYNLIGNALKFSREGTAPRISISGRALPATELWRYPSLHAGEPYFLITVSDNGIGFDPSLKDKLFTVFQRLNAGEKYEGNGIGLALCKKIVFTHGGMIWANGEREKGAEFHIILPLTQSKADYFTENA